MYNNYLNFVHESFKWNGNSHSVSSLIDFANDLIHSENQHEKDAAQFIIDWFDDSNFIVLTTSGTTGNPKQITILKTAMIASVLATAAFFDLNSKFKVLQCLPSKYIAGKMMLLRSFILGFDMDFVIPSSNPLASSLTIYDFVAMVPMQVQNSITELNRVKILIIGGAKLDDSLRFNLQNITTSVFETFGMTETITHIAARNVNKDYFEILPNITINTDNRGCLIIDAPLLNSEKIVTNDLVNLLDNNRFQFLGRIDNVINSGGVKLIPEQIEAKLLNKIESRFFIIGVPDKLLGEKAILVIEGEYKSLPNTIFDDLETFEKPKEVKFISNFKETESGKIMRKNTILA